MPAKKEANVKSIKKKTNSKNTNSSKKKIDVAKKKKVNSVKVDSVKEDKKTNLSSTDVKVKQETDIKKKNSKDNKSKTQVIDKKKSSTNSKKNNNVSTSKSSNKSKNVKSKTGTPDKKVKNTELNKESTVKKNNKKEVNKTVEVKTNTKNKKLSKKEKLLDKKVKKWFLSVAFICVFILILEGAYFIKYKMDIDKKTVYYDSLNSVSIDDSDIVAVGSSNFRYSKYNSYTKGLEKGKIIKYDKKGKVLFETKYDNGINTTFSSVITVEDGYIVVGSGVFSEDEQQNGGREAIILKYDKDGKLVWEKFYQVLTNTRFNKVIKTSDGYVAIGQSIYANMEMGNHTTGGGIIVKYDFEGNVVWKNNHGGTKSGNFNDIVEVNDSFYVVGKDGSDSANIVKFDKNGKYSWHKNYSYTDGIGFTGITYLNDYLYVVGSKKVLPEDISEEDDRNTTNTDALLVKYDLNGKVKLEKTFGGSNYERYNSIEVYNGDLYVIGHLTSTDAGLKVETDGELMTGLVVRYDTNGNILKKVVFGGNNNDNLTDIVNDGASLYITAYSNSDDGNITTSKNNGKDYFGKVIKLDSKLRSLLIK